MANFTGQNFESVKATSPTSTSSVYTILGSVTSKPFSTNVFTAVVYFIHPVAGRVVKENAKITIYQSGGKKKSKMANFTGQN
jgi:beta-lactam-binding protein with PASTA domain